MMKAFRIAVVILAMAGPPICLLGYFAGFDRVADIRAVKDGVELVAANGKRARAEVDLGWLGGSSAGSRRGVVARRRHVIGGSDGRLQVHPRSRTRAHGESRNNRNAERPSIP